MSQKLKSALFALVGLALVVVTFAMDKGVETVTDIEWNSLALWGAVIGWAMGWLAKTPSDAHAIDKNGGRQ